VKHRSYNIVKFWFFLGVAVCVFISITGVARPLQANDNTYKSLKLFTDVLEELECG